MSSSGVDVMQKKLDDTPIIWREYEALRDHLTVVFNNTTDSIETEVRSIQLKLTMHAIQT
jgi:hypothetical protein